MPRTIGTVVATLRHRQGLSQKRLEKISGGKVRSNWLAALEKDRIKNPPPDKIEVLAGFLDTTVFELYQLSGVIVPPSSDGTTATEQELLDQFRSLSPQEQRIVLNLTRDLGRAAHAGFSLADAEDEEPKKRAKGKHGQ